MRLPPPVRRCFALAALLSMAAPLAIRTPAARGADALESLPRRGVCVLLGGAEDSQRVKQLARASELLIYVQSPDDGDVIALRRMADREGLLGVRIFVERGDLGRLHLADNLADAVVVTDSVKDSPRLRRSELLRVVRPGGRVLLGEEDVLIKPPPEGLDDWSHPYHGPDNNPQSRDAAARAPYLTQFLSDPWYTPMPEVTVAAGGRVFKAFGHIALKEREWPWMNTLVALNGYNGTQLWKRALQPGFMIHRNTLIATPRWVYLADSLSCKQIDAATGQLKDEIVIPPEIDSDGVWKWMALQHGVLYALVGEKEPKDPGMRGARTQSGWPWTGLGDAYGGEYSWGFGRTLLALDPRTKKVLWTYRSARPIDSRAMCLSAGRIYVYCRGKSLASVDAATGREIWTTSDARLLAAIGSDDRAQTASKGFSSSAYAKANEIGVYFAGPQRKRLVAVSAKDGQLMWDYPDGNFQLLLRDDALYAMGRMQTSKKFDYRTGRILADLQCYRGNCTRATASIDSIFTRGYRHTGTMRLDLASGEPRRIPLMRPDCEDGVIVAQGHLYFGPWMCDCNHSLVGMIALAPAGDFDFAQQATASERLESDADADSPIASLPASPRDWPSYRGGPQGTASSQAAAPARAALQWQWDSPNGADPTAPIAAGGLVFWSGLDGIVRAADAASGRLRWTAYAGGEVRFPPAVWRDRLYVGSGDGWVYCFEAATGRRLWRFRAAPQERRIPVHGRLVSTWPVGGGVLVADGVVYAAAGIASYDGTHVYALDAKTGEILWQNNTSGHLAGEPCVSGVSVQGHLLLDSGRLYLAGGNVISPAVYDIRDGRCLNELKNEWLNAPLGASLPLPDPRPAPEMFPRSPRGRDMFLVDGQVRVNDRLLYAPHVYQRSRYFGGDFLQASSEDQVVRAVAGGVARLAPGAGEGQRPKALWENKTLGDPAALALCRNAVLAAGREEAPEDASASTCRLVALDIEDGRELWSHALPAAPVPWGLAVDSSGRAIVTLVGGTVLGFGE